VAFISFPWIFHWVMIRIAMGDKYKPGKSVLAAARRTHLFKYSQLELQSQLVHPTSAVTVVDDERSDSRDQGDISGPKKSRDTIQQPEVVSKSGANSEQETEENISDYAPVAKSQPDEAAVDRLAALLGYGGG
jgi:hypothetical protein